MCVSGTINNHPLRKDSLNMTYRLYHYCTILLVCLLYVFILQEENTAAY